MVGKTNVDSTFSETVAMDSWMEMANLASVQPLFWLLIGNLRELKWQESNNSSPKTL